MLLYNFQLSFMFVIQITNLLNIPRFTALYFVDNAPLSSKKPVVHEYYDEIVFNDPTVSFYKTLMQGPTMDVPRHPLTDHFGSFDELEDLKRLMAAQAYVKLELEHCRQHLTKIDGTLNTNVKLLPNATVTKSNKKKRGRQAAVIAAAAVYAAAAEAAAESAADTASTTASNVAMVDSNVKM